MLIIIIIIIKFYSAAAMGRAGLLLQPDGLFCILSRDGQLGAATRGDRRGTGKRSLLLSQVLERRSLHAMQGHRESTRFCCFRLVALTLLLLAPE